MNIPATRRKLAPYAAVLAAAAIAIVPPLHAGTPPPPGLTPYGIGNPSEDETLLLELINRARANPTAEGQRLAATFLPAFNQHGEAAALAATFASYPLRAPLAFNAKLNAEAASHNPDMRVANDTIEYGLANPNGGIPARFAAFGYLGGGNDNLAGSADGFLSILGVHDAYQIDYGQGLGHRSNIMEFDGVGFAEIGIANLLTGGVVGIWNTEDFGGNTTPPLLTGVVFSDKVNAGFYATGGEGVVGITVTAPGASSYYALTTASGAYTLPLDRVPAYSDANPHPSVTVNFTDAAGAVHAQSVALNRTVDAVGNSYHYQNPRDTNGVFHAGLYVRYDNAKADWMQGANGGGGGLSITPVVGVAVSGGNPLAFTVSRSGADLSQPVKVQYKVAGSAVAGVDYLALPGTKNLKGGKANAAITVHPLPGGKGTVKIKLLPGSGYTLNATGIVAKMKIAP